MRLKGIKAEDFVNFRLPSLFLAACSCDFKCCRESGLDTSVCQNSALAHAEIKDVPNEVIYAHYANNPITKAVVVGGLEPMLQATEIRDLIDLFRIRGDLSPFVIYTGYYPGEIEDKLAVLRPLGNIIVKFGRYIPGRPCRYDDLLGVELASDNQYAEKIC